MPSGTLALSMSAEKTKRQLRGPYRRGGCWNALPWRRLVC